MKRLTSRKGASPYHPNLQDEILYASASDQCMLSSSFWATASLSPVNQSL